jgi:hypothetical protein
LQEEEIHFDQKNPVKRRNGLDRDEAVSSVVQIWTVKMARTTRLSEPGRALTHLLGDGFFTAEVRDLILCFVIFMSPKRFM